MNPVPRHHDDRIGTAHFALMIAGLAVLVTVVVMLLARSGEFSGWLPFLLILACPLMHRFMHRGHSVGGQAGPAANQSTTERRD